MFKCPKCGHVQETLTRHEVYEINHPDDPGGLTDSFIEFECGHLLYTHGDVEKAYIERG